MLAAGVVAVSFSAILIRKADAPALSIAFYRNAMAAAVLIPLAVTRHGDEIRSLSRAQIAVATGAGGLLALHFATWIPSLSYTTVAASTVLVTTQPVWVAILGRAFLREGIGTTGAAGIGIALAGTAFVSGGDFGVSSRAVIGDVLALSGAVFAAGYFVIGRSLRRTLSLLVYVGIVYATCAMMLLAAMAISGTAFGGFPVETWGLLVLMALVPQILGHTVFNFLLRHLEVTVVAVAIMGEPVGASLLALGFFGEVPPWTAVAGGALILGGIYLAITAQARRAIPAPVE